MRNITKVTLTNPYEYVNLWRTVHSAPNPVRPTLEHILESWFFERFKTCTHKEVLAMFQNLCPLEETIAYQGIFAEGMAKGEAKGEAKGIAKGIAKGKAEFLKHLIIRRFKKLPKWADKLINEADTEQLEAWAEAIFDAQDIKQLLGRVAYVSQPNIALLVNMLGCQTDGNPT